MLKSHYLSEDSLQFSKMLHEIKNPLTLISSSLQLIEEEHPEVAEFRFWKQTIKDVENLRFLLNDLSSFQKSSLLNITKIHLFDFTEDLLESMEGYLMEHEIQLTLNCPVLNLDFDADDLKLRQAIINLLKNAAENSSSGSRMELQIFSEDPLLHIFVKDHGCGIDARQMVHIFEPFHTTKSYGTGLGLPIVKNIMEAHHGTISINSSPDTGTVVHLTLPLTQQSVDFS